MQVVEKSFEEQFNMYIELPKEEVVKMLIECNKHLSNILSFRIKDFTNDEEIHKMD